MENLDTQELLHLAMFAASKDHHDDALTYLKQALKQEPKNPNVCLLLAAEYAEIGMYDRALEFFDSAERIDPNLKIAALQSSLLLISLDRLEEAKTKLEQLKTLDDTSYMGLFASGLLYLIEENFTSAHEQLTKGCLANQDNLPLNEDITKIIKQIENHNADNDNNEFEPEETNSLLMSTYNT